MIERLLEQRQAVESVFLNPEFINTAFSKKLLSSNLEWNYLKALVIILKPFEVATTLMSSQSESTIAVVPPLIYWMIDKFLKHNDTNDFTKIRLLKQVFQEELVARVLNEDCDSVCALAWFLDPRYKNMADETQEYRDSVQEKLLKIMANDIFQGISVVANKNKREKDLDYLFNYLFAFVASSATSPQNKQNISIIPFFTRPREVQLMTLKVQSLQGDVLLLQFYYSTL
ncbi:unnamed protein product [Brassicogethes aeneus]|uniref:Uncharacterized protein n=1 Tax=Brassicogethes aeneus TaxID=1431903 RepID=A0A9P0FLU7_BRAAE|nr:unnamed protein product [Brassicogethes aeneus]